MNSGWKKMNFDIGLDDTVELWNSLQFVSCIVVCLIDSPRQQIT